MAGPGLRRLTNRPLSDYLKSFHASCQRTLHAPSVLDPIPAFAAHIRSRHYLRQPEPFNANRHPRLLVDPDLFPVAIVAALVLQLVSLPLKLLANCHLLHLSCGFPPSGVSPAPCSMVTSSAPLVSFPEPVMRYSYAF